MWTDSQWDFKARDSSGQSQWWWHYDAPPTWNGWFQCCSDGGWRIFSTICNFSVPLWVYFSWSGWKHIPRSFVKRHLSADAAKPWMPTRFYKLTWHGRITPSNDVMPASFLPCTHHSVPHSSHPERTLCHQGLHCRSSRNCNRLHVCISSVASMQFGVHV